MRLGDFPTLGDALDYAASGATGFNFYSARGDLVEVASYAALAGEARVVGGRLRGRGLEAGDRVGLIAETHADFVRAFMGCLYARLIPCPMPLPSAFGARESYADHVRRIADVADIRAAVTPDLVRTQVVAALEGRGLAFLGTLVDLDNAPTPLPAGRPAPGDLAYLQFSSGTTSAPKGIAISHAALMANITGIATHGLETQDNDRATSWLPFYHDMGLVGFMLSPIGTQRSVDYLATRDFVRRPGLWLDLISRTRATLSYAPSFGYELAARRARTTQGLDLSHWRVAGIGGDMIKARNLEIFADAFAAQGFRSESFLPSYGMAEATLALSFARLGRGCESEMLDLDALQAGLRDIARDDAGRRRRFAICGPALPLHAFEIRDADGAPVPEGRIGTIHARGPSLMSGYFRDDAATAAALSADGWLDTGDLGYLLGDNLVVTGRAKDLIIINGRNIWPQDIEWSVEQGVVGAREGGVVAFGVTPDSEDGESVEEQVAIVMECRQNEAQAREAIRLSADRLVREAFGLAPQIAFLGAGSLPRTSSGKLSRARAREMFRAGAFET